MGERKRDLDDEQTERLRQHIEAAVSETNQSRVAEALGVKPSTISSIIGRRQGGSFAMAFEIAKLRAIPLSAILGEETVRRIVDLEQGTDRKLDPKRQVQRSPAYLDAIPKVQRAFDRDDRYTSSSVAGKATFEMYMRRLLQIIDEERAGVLIDPDELIPGARIVPAPVDADRSVKTKKKA